MNHNHVHMSHDMHHHSNISKHNHLDTNDHHSMMKMYFHTGSIETILFEQWKTTSISIFIISWIFIFILSILYEGTREILQCFNEEQLTQKSTTSNDENELEKMNTESSPSTQHVKKKISLRPMKRLQHSILYTIHLALGYVLMLIAMTFNIYLFLAIIFGLGTGHFIYACNRLIPLTSRNQRRT